MFLSVRNFLKKNPILHEIVRKYRRIKIRAHEVIKLLPPNSLIFDIGAHLGDKSLSFLKNDMRVLMVEPNPIMCKLLNTYFSKNPNVKILQKGIGEKKRKAVFYISDSAPGASTLCKSWQTLNRFKRYKIKYNRTINIDLVTLDYLIKKYGSPDYIKIDIENYEYYAISGLKNKNGIISFEFVNENFDNIIKCLNKLVKIGYKEFNFSLGDNNFFYFQKFKKKKEMPILLKTIKNLSSKNSELWGDIYAK
jgi:FkbM family methyltransferase